MLQFLRGGWTSQIVTGASAASLILHALLGYILQFSVTVVRAEGAPEWWNDRDVIKQDAEIDNGAIVNLGQLKWISSRFYKELETLLPQDLDFQLTGADGLFPDATLPFEDGYEGDKAKNSLLAVLGQAKAIALPFYDQLNAISPAWVKQQLVQSGLDAETLETSHKKDNGYYYPWTDTPDDDANKAPINIGQLKLLFSMRVRADDEVEPFADGLSDLFELALMAMSDSDYANYIGQPGATNPFSSLDSINDISIDEGGNVVSYRDETGSLQLSKVPASQAGLVRSDSAVSALLAEHEAIGAVGGTFSPGSDGSANYSIPIDLPAGTSGMAPALGLSYSSHGGNGLLGVGFNIAGLQRITRGPASYHKDGFVDGVDFDLNDRFFLDGQRLVCVSGNYGEVGSEYRTEVDNFAQIYLKSDGALNHGLYWQIETKSGTTVYLGKCNTSCVSSADETEHTPIVWMVTRVEDVYKNYYEVEYDLNAMGSDGRDYRPSLVRYTGNDEIGLAPYIEVDFQYEERPDKTFGFVHGTKTANTTRLSRVAVSTLGQLNYSYELTYIDETADEEGVKYRSASGVLDRAKYLAEWQTLRSKLRSITRVSSAGSELEPTSFTWNKPPSGSRWKLESDWEVPKLRKQALISDLGWRWADINSDGLSDLIRAYDSNSDGDNIDSGDHSALLLNTGNGFENQDGFQVPLPFIKANGKTTDVRLLDMNLDGILDITKAGSSNSPVEIDPNIIWTYVRRNKHNGEDCWMMRNHRGHHTWGFPDRPYDNEDISYDNEYDIRDETYRLSSKFGQYIRNHELREWIRAREQGSGLDIPPAPSKSWFASYLSSLNWAGEAETHTFDGGEWTEIASIGGDPLTFPRPFSDSVGSDRGVVVQDFNGDGLYDIVESSTPNSDVHVAGNNVVYLMKEDGTFYKDDAYQLPANLIKYPSQDARNKGVSWLEFGDINGDGETDLMSSVLDLTKPVGEQYQPKTWLRGAKEGIDDDPESQVGWEENADYTVPFPLSRSDGQPTSSVIIDVNGDGLLDLVKSTQYTYPINTDGLTTYSRAGFNDIRNNETGQKLSSVYPVHIGASWWQDSGGHYYVSNPEGVFFKYSDYKGDGARIKESEIWINSGKGFYKSEFVRNGVSYDHIIPHINTFHLIVLNGSAFKEERVEASIELADFNGDGLVDCINSDNTNGYGHVNNKMYINDGQVGWIQDLSFTSPLDVFVHDSADDRENGRKHVDYIDVNGDGFLDIVDDVDTDSPDVYINQCKPEVIIEITDGLGARIKADYAYGHNEFPSSVNASLHTDILPGLNEGKLEQVYAAPVLTPAGAVSPPVIKSGIGGFLLTSYAEEDGKGGFRWKHRQYGPRAVDRPNEANLGFEWILDVDEQTGAHSITKLNQTFPMEGNSIAEYSFAPTAAGHQLLSETHHQYGFKVHFDSCDPETEQGCGKVYHVFQKESTKMNYHAGTPGLELATNHTTYLDDSGEPRIDAYGNVLGMTVTTTRPAESGKAESLTIETQSEYGESEFDQRKGRLSYATTTKTWVSGGVTNTRVKEACFTYNPITHVLDSECAEPNDSNAVTKSYTYDAFGNRATTTITPKFDSTLAARTTGTEYDERGRFALKSYFLDGETKVYTSSSAYNQERALLVSATDLLNNLTSRFYYDEWGTQVRSVSPLGIESVEITRRANASEASPSGAQLDPSSARVAYIKKSKSTGTPTSVGFYDPQGRMVLTCGEGFNGQNIYTQTLYDSLGRQYKSSQPYFSGDTILWSEQFFDDYQRPYRVTFSDNSSEEGDFSVPYQLTQRNRDGKRRRSTTDLLGETVSVEDLDAGTIVTTAQQWLTPSAEDRTAVISTVTAPGDHTIVSKTDIFGNIISVSDPDTGTHSTTFNAYGETLTVIDAIGTVTESRFDDLGRVTEKIRPEGTVKYFYDDGGNLAPGASHRALYRTAQYDANSQLTFEATTAFDRYGRTVSGTTKRRWKVSNSSGSFNHREETSMVSTTYDELGRTRTETDAGGLTLLHEYDDRGFEIRLRDYHTGEVYYEPITVDASGRVREERLGGGITTNNEYRETTGVMLSTTSTGNGTTYQDLHTDWDNVGNLTSREDKLQNIKETFSYDDAYRLTGTTFTKSGHAPVTSNYAYTADNTGNILTMPDVAGSAAATYLYEDSTATHRLTGLSGDSSGDDRHYDYNANGDLTREYKGNSAAGQLRREVSWTSFHKVKELVHYAPKKVVDTRGAAAGLDGISYWDHSPTTVGFAYGPGDSRVRKVTSTDSVSKVTHYFGGYERIHEYSESSDLEVAAAQEAEIKVVHRHHIGGVAMKEIVVDANGTRGPPRTKYFLKDHLGSTTVTLQKDGMSWTVLNRSSFDPWGRARSEEGWIKAQDGETIANQETDRGYTGHEMLDEIGLIHMNGRIYDSELGRFLSADPHVQAPENAQNYNRYAYVLNNPLSYTDPSGFFFKKLWKSIKRAFKSIWKALTNGIKLIKKAARWVKENWRAVVSIAFAFALSFVPGLGAFAQGFISSAFNSAINGGDIGDILKEGLIGGITAVVNSGFLHTQGVEAKDAWKAVKAGKGSIASAIGKTAKHVVSHGIVGGTRNALTGGKFSDGFKSAAVTALAGYLPKVGPLLDPKSDAGKRIGLGGRTALAAIIGGTTSALSGGDFANGAYTAAFQHLFNAEFENMAAVFYHGADDGFGDATLGNGEDFERAAKALATKGYAFDSNSVAEIHEWLSMEFGEGAFDRVYLLDHGSPGLMTMGKGLLGASIQIADYMKIAKYIKPNGYLVLTGCSVCAGQVGEKHLLNISKSIPNVNVVAANVKVLVSKSGSRVWLPYNVEGAAWRIYKNGKYIRDKDSLEMK